MTVKRQRTIPSRLLPFMFLFLALFTFVPHSVHAADPNFPDSVPPGDAAPEFSTGSDEGSGSDINPLGKPNRILFSTDIGFVPTVGPNVSGATGNSQPGVGFLLDIQGGYTILPSLVLTAGMSIQAFGNLTNLPLFLGAQYYFDNGGGLPFNLKGETHTLIPYIEMGFGPAFNISTDSNKVGVGTLAIAFRIGPGVLLPFGKNKHQGLYFEIDYETQSGPFNGDGISSSAFTLIPVKLGYTTVF